MAWMFLMLPIIYILLQNLIVQIHVVSGVQSAPKEIDLSSLQNTQYGMTGAKIVPQDTQQTQPKLPAVQVDRPSTTSISQPMGSVSGNSVQAYGGNMQGNYF